MIIDGKQLTHELLTTLSLEVRKLKEQGIVPTLKVILVGDNPASLSYIKQKQKAAEAIGAKLILSHQLSALSHQQLKICIEEGNNDPKIHGIIVQRPLPLEASNLQPLLLTVNPKKDVDGFVPGSPFPVPVALAIEKILMNIYSSSEEPALPAGRSTTNREVTRVSSRPRSNNNFYEWLRTQKIVIIGRGETAGKPISEHMNKLCFAMQSASQQQQIEKCATSVITSQTINPDAILKQATVIISCVGKNGVIRSSNISKGVILISVGIWRDSEGKLHGDYEEEEIKDIASFYTPTPGGVGPVNVACLMQNLVTAATQR